MKQFFFAGGCNQSRFQIMNSFCYDFEYSCYRVVKGEVQGEGVP